MPKKKKEKKVENHKRVPDEKIWQEFYCRKEGGGCGGYILVKLNPAISGTVKVICPKCGHDHQRQIKNGEIVGDQRYDNKPIEELRPTLAAWSKEPRTLKMTNVSYDESCNAAVISDASHFIKERAFELWGGSE